jgi:putative flippase GtrA
MKKEIFQKIAPKYTAVSLISTAVDFLIFGIMAYFTNFPNSFSTALSASGGGWLSYIMHKNWVFLDTKRKKNSIRWRYFVGVLLGIVANVLLVGIFCDHFACPPMYGRILASLGVWVAVFWFNKKVVFKV